MKNTLFVLLLVSLFSCKKEVPVILPKEVSYSGDIKPMMAEHGCEGCHNGTKYPYITRLDSFQSLKTAVVKDNFFPQLSPGPGMIYSAMPPYNSSYVMVSDQEIEKIKEWIRQGFKK